MTVFQSHIGSITTMKNAYSSSSTSSVSIPHWFDYDGSLSFLIISTLIVSIPHWFDYDFSWLPYAFPSLAFQSHIGSITTIAYERRCITRSRFNPTLVRLRHEHSPCAVQDRQCFNPTLVRLRRFPFPVRWRTPRSFNPTLVRLRLWKVQRAQVPMPGFNPTLVRLRPESKFGHRLTSTRFNPTLVRLRLNVVTASASMCSVSIPHWFDYDGIHRFAWRRGPLVSIPHWFDYDESRRDYRVVA